MRLFRASWKKGVGRVPPNRHQRRARVARGRRAPAQRPRTPRSEPARLCLLVAGLLLLVVPILLLGTLHGTRVPRGLLLLPVAGCALIVLAWRG